MKYYIQFWIYFRKKEILDKSKKLPKEVMSLPSLTAFAQRLGKQCSDFFLVDPKRHMHILATCCRASNSTACLRTKLQFTK